MVVFVILLLAPMAIQHFVVGTKFVDYEKKNKRALLLFFFMLTVLVAFRHETVGKDTESYIYYFNNFIKLDWREVGKVSLEAGFSYYNKLVSVFTNEIQVFFAITAVATSLMIYPTYRRLCVDTSLTIVLFCIMSTFVMMFSGLRQMIAIGIGFIAYEFARRKKPILFIIAVIFAIMFHTSAFVLIFFYPLYHAKITKKWLFSVVPLLTIIFIFNKQIFSVLALFLEKYTKYDASLKQTSSYTMIILFVAFAVFSFLIPDESKLDKETIGLRNFLLLALALQMFAPLHTIAMRINYYYIIFIPLLLPKIIESRSDRWAQVAVVGRHIMVVFFALYFFFFAAFSNGSLNVFPYHFFWENV